MLSFRSFVQGEDEAVWTRICRVAHAAYDYFGPTTVDEMAVVERHPTFDPSGMLLAEWDRQPVGCVHAYVDPKRTDGKGFIRELAVLPDYQRRGVGRRLLKIAVDHVKTRGMTTVEGWATDDRIACQKLYELAGFRVIRHSSGMRRSLASIPSDIGENTQVQITVPPMDEANIRRLHELGNATFKDHFNFRPRTLEETRYSVVEDTWLDVSQIAFAAFNDTPVGFVKAGMNTKRNRATGRQRGIIASIGVLSAYRRRGVGTALLLHSLHYLKTLGLDVAELYVDDLNPTRAIKLYERVGFSTFETSATYSKKIR